MQGTADGQGLARVANPYLTRGGLALDWADGWLHGERLGYVPEPARWAPLAQA